MDIREHIQRDPSNDWTLEMLFNPAETDLIRSMFREKIALYIAKGRFLDLNGHDFSMTTIEVSKGTSIYTSNTNNLAGDLDYFNENTADALREMATKLPGPAHTDTTLSARYYLGQNATQLAAEIREKAAAFNAEGQHAIESSDVSFLNSINIDPNSLA